MSIVLFDLLLSLQISLLVSLECSLHIYLIHLWYYNCPYVFFLLEPACGKHSCLEATKGGALCNCTGSGMEGQFCTKGEFLLAYYTV